MKHTICSTALLLTVCLFAHSQQLPVLNQALYNSFLLNPANAGIHSYTQAFMHVRDQWSGMPGAPFSYVLSIDGNLKNEHSGVGFMLQGDRQPVINNISGMLSYRYTAKLAENHSLRMALSAGLVYNSINIGKIEAASPTENTLMEKSLSKAAFDVNAGLAYRFKNFELGFAALQLTNPTMDYTNRATDEGLKYNFVRCFNASASYRIDAGKEWGVTPVAILYSTQGMPAYLLGAVKVAFQDDYWAAAGYRTDKSLAFSCGVVLSERLNIGYSFELPVNSSATHIGNTHEVTLGIRIFGKNAGAGRQQVTSKDLAQLADVIQIQSQKIDELAQQANRQKEQSDRQQQKYDSQRAELETLISNHAAQSAQDDIKEKSLSPEQLNSETNDAAATAGRYIVVVGAYNNLTDAKLYQKILEREVGLVTWLHARQTGQTRFLVYSRIVKTQKEALSEYDRLYNLNIERFKQGNLWIFQLKTEE